MKMYQGGVDVDETWEQIGSVGTFDGVEWIVFIKKEEQQGWRNVKVVANGKAPNKANYWLGWNGSRLSSMADKARLEQNRPKLMQSVIAKLMEL